MRRKQSDAKGQFDEVRLTIALQRGKRACARYQIADYRVIIPRNVGDVTDHLEWKEAIVEMDALLKNGTNKLIKQPKIKRGRRKQLDFLSKT